MLYWERAQVHQGTMRLVAQNQLEGGKTVMRIPTNLMGQDTAQMA